MFQNPLLIKELRSLIRGKKSFITLTMYVSLLASIILLVYRSKAHHTGYFSGRDLFYVLAFAQLIAVCLISPALTAPSMTLEKEKQTLNMLLITLLSPFQIISGKMISTLSFVFILLILSLPFSSISFILGGISPGEVLLTYGILINVMLTYGIIGYLCSIFFKQTRTSTSVTFIVIAALSLGSMLFAVLLDELNITNQKIATGILFPFTPIAALISVLEPNTFSNAIRRVWIISIPMWVMHLIYSAILFLGCSLIAFKKFKCINRET